jgi:hypothetical protein
MGNGLNRLDAHGESQVATDDQWPLAAGEELGPRNRRIGHRDDFHPPAPQIVEPATTGSTIGAKVQFVLINHDKTAFPAFLASGVRARARAMVLLRA